MEKFKCTSPKLKKYLMDNGLRYLWVDKDQKGMTYWVFEKSEDFYKYYKKYNEK